MPIEYDPVKAAANLKKHAVSFADAEGFLPTPWHSPWKISGRSVKSDSSASGW